jgi:hypothetical protein
VSSPPFLSHYQSLDVEVDLIENGNRSQYILGSSYNVLIFG